jgi:hypothetical protein
MVSACYRMEMMLRQWGRRRRWQRTVRWRGCPTPYRKVGPSRPAFREVTWWRRHTEWLVFTASVLLRFLLYYCILHLLSDPDLIRLTQAVRFCLVGLIMRFKLFPGETHRYAATWCGAAPTAAPARERSGRRQPGSFSFLYTVFFFLKWADVWT